jgi:hypothetical protein
MTFRAHNFVARAHSFLRTFWALPAFLIVSLIPWLLSAHAFELSRKFYDAGRDTLGVAFRVAAIIMAAFTAFSTLWFLVIWLWMLARCIRGFKTHDDT